MPDASLAVRTPRLRLLWWVPALLLALVGLGWWLTHPPALSDPLAGQDVRATTTVNRPVYVGVWQPGAQDPEVRLEDVQVDVTDGDATPLVCRDGRVSVTSQAETFCAQLDEGDGAAIGPQDQLVLQLSGSAAGARVVANPTRVFYRDGLRGGTQDLGPRILVRIGG